MPINDGFAPGEVTPVNLQTAAGVDTGVVATPLRVDPTGTTTQPVSASTLPLPTGASTSANQTTQITSLQLLDDVPAAQNAAFSKGHPVMGQLDDTTTVAATEDNVAAVRITAQRAFHSNLRTAAGVEIGVSASPVRTDPTGTTTQPVSAASLPLPTGAATSANQTTEITSLQLLDDVPAANNAAFSKGTPIMGQLDDTSTLAATEDNVASVRITAQRGLHANLRSAAGTEIGTTSNPIVSNSQNASGTTAIVLSALGDFFLQAGMLKYSGLVFTVTGTWVGTIEAFGSADGGTTFTTLPVVQLDAAESTTQLSVDANGSYFFPISLDFVKISLTAYTSGTVTLRTAFTTGSQNPAQNSLLAQIAKVSITDSYAPRLPYTVTGTGRLITDADQQLITRGDVLTDEGTFRDDFTGVAIDVARWTSTFSGTGANVTVASSLVNLISGTDNTANASIVTTGDYGPISVRSQFSLTQRIANQTTRFGFADDFTTPTVGAYFQFTGTSNTVVDCISRSSTAAADTQTTAANIPNGTSATSGDYYIEIQPDQVTFFINGFQVAQHRLHMPGPYDAVDIGARIVNAAVVTTTTLAIDYIYFINQNSLQINNSFFGDDLPVRVKTGTIATYAAAITGLTVAAAPTDIFTITGSATKTIKVVHISVDGTRTTATNTNIALIKRSTANTAGTSTAPTATSYDSNNPAATATVLAYTANPTLGTTVGTIHSEKLFMPTATTLGDELEFDFTNNSNAQDLTLRGTGQVLAINLGGTAVAGSSFNIDITWTEE